MGKHNRSRVIAAESSWEPAENLEHAKEAVQAFHQSYSEKPEGTGRAKEQATAVTDYTDIIGREKGMNSTYKKPDNRRIAKIQTKEKEKQHYEIQTELKGVPASPRPIDVVSEGPEGGRQMLIREFKEMNTALKSLMLLKTHETATR